MSNNDNTINTMVEEITTILNASQTVARGMKDGERMSVKDLAKAVGLAISLEPSKIFPFVNYFAHNDTEGYVSAGKFGGYIRGARRSAMKPVVAPATTTDTTTDTNTDTNTSTNTSTIPNV